MWMNAANNPRAGPAARNAVRRWAEARSCPYCWNTDWTSALRWRWIDLSSSVDHFLETGQF